jgi:hypothetical protein
MATRAAGEARQTYLVEHYRPGLTVDDFRRWAERVRASASELAREGKDCRYVRSAVVPADESLLCVIEAASEGLVREIYARAGIPFERVSALIAEGTPGWAVTAPVEIDTS